MLYIVAIIVSDSQVDSHHHAGHTGNTNASGLLTADWKSSYFAETCQPDLPPAESELSCHNMGLMAFAVRGVCLSMINWVSSKRCILAYDLVSQATSTIQHSATPVRGCIVCNCTSRYSKLIHLFIILISFSDQLFFSLLFTHPSFQVTVLHVKRMDG